VGKRKWEMIQTAQWAICAVDRIEEDTLPFTKKFCPLQIVWGDRNRTHSFVSQGGNCERIQFEMKKDGIDLICTLPPQDEGKSGEQAQDLMFFVDAYEGLKKMVAEKEATTFQLGEEVRIESDGLDLRLMIQLAEGEMMGHLSQGNRPAQCGLKGKHRFAAFDWQFFVRSVRRTGPSQLRVSIRLKGSEQ